MKKATSLFEYLVEQTVERNNAMSKYLVMLLVLFIAAGSLYMLLNSQG